MIRVAGIEGNPDLSDLSKLSDDDFKPG